ncbi:thermonuclease family protein [Rhizomicrobium electricum]|uniref:TNase-like domain-containing protein n=1 Tax=Rhizomicrobium electricum TaxID=480070 RepID=A0ABN1EZ73_9PROT|nr:thermonuclease family protein [Rhizomicrobium electricum]NIJ50076.1 endonuclease YncB(thermonuclease family) [Rhizomicrobium electricum]
MRSWTIALAVAAMAAPSFAAAPPCAGDIEIADAHIMRVEKNGVLVMTDGRALKLEGIRLPAGPADRAPQALAERAFAELESLAKGARLDARATWPKEDRYDRVRGQIFTRDGTWLQLDLLKKGLARVELLPDRGECNLELYAAEAEAHKAGAGLWADPAYATRRADQIAADVGTFQLVIGRVAKSFSTQENGIVLVLGPDPQRDLTVRISADDVKRFKWLGVDPLNYDGKLIRVRGVVQPGPSIAVGNPRQIELLQ